MKQNIAIIIPGGIGTGHNNIGVPVLERIIKLLSPDFNLTVFQLFPVNKNYEIEGFELIEIYSPYPILKGLKLFFAFWKIQRQRNFRVVHGFWALPNGFMAVLMGKIFSIRSIVSVLGGDAIALPEIEYGQLQNPLYRKFILWTLRHADEVNALTQYLIDNLKKAGCSRNDIKVIPWGIDTKLFSFQEKHLQEPVQFLHIANLHPVKDPETLLRAFKIISNKIHAHLTIIGVGILEQYVKDLTNELGLTSKITFMGLLPYETLPRVYGKADILLHTSLSEGQCEVVTEAMSCGVLVCGTAVGLIYDLPTCCIGVPVKHFETLGSEVLKLLDDPQRMRRTRNNAYAWASNHSIHWTTKKIKELYLIEKSTSNNKLKPRIALFAMGVMGGGKLGYGIPVLRDLFERLSKHYNIVFYAFGPIDESKVPIDIRVRQIKLRFPGRLKYLLLSLKFVLDNIVNPFNLIFAVSIYPTGHWAVRLGKIINRPVLVQLIALEAVALLDIGCGNLTIPWLKKITVKVCEKADVLITVADYQKTMAQHDLSTMREIKVLPLRIDYKKFEYHKRSISFPVQFIHVAYYSPIKDQDTMFVAFAKVAQCIDCHLTIIGNGFNVPRVHSLLAELQIAHKVTFIGEVDQSELPRHFHDAHILLHTARFETGCAVIQEAMASGVAVCGTQVGILADIGDRYAVIVPVGDAEQLAYKILQLVDNHDMYEKITLAAYQWITTYDSEWSCQNYKLFIDSTLSKTV